MRDSSKDKIIVYLIRHGMTEGNSERRYIGTTDEDLCEEGIKRLKEKEYPVADICFVSPMKRCRQTADIIYPNMKPVTIEELKEIDFGLFEGKNYEELSGDKFYQEWIDSNGRLDFPQGETMKDFTSRTMKGFGRALDMIKEEGTQTAAFVVHGGTIMSLISGLGIGDYFDSIVNNGDTVTLEVKKLGENIEARII